MSAARDASSDADASGGGASGLDAAAQAAADAVDDSSRANVGSWDVSTLSLPDGMTELKVDGEVTRMGKHPTKGWAVTVGSHTFFLGLPSRMKPAFAVGDVVRVSMYRAHPWHGGTTGALLDAAGEPLVISSEGGPPPKGGDSFKVELGAALKTTTEGRQTTETHQVRFRHVSGRQAISGEARRLVTPSGTFVVSGTSVSVRYSSGPIPPETSDTFVWSVLRER